MSDPTIDAIASAANAAAERYRLAGKTVRAWIIKRPLGTAWLAVGAAVIAFLLGFASGYIRAKW